MKRGRAILRRLRKLDLMDAMLAVENGIEVLYSENRVGKFYVYLIDCEIYRYIRTISCLLLLSSGILRTLDNVDHETSTKENSRLLKRVMFITVPNQHLPRQHKNL